MRCTYYYIFLFRIQFQVSMLRILGACMLAWLTTSAYARREETAEREREKKSNMKNKCTQFVWFDVCPYFSISFSLSLALPAFVIVVWYSGIENRPIARQHTRVHVMLFHIHTHTTAVHANICDCQWNYNVRVKMKIEHAFMFPFCVRIPYRYRQRKVIFMADSCVALHFLQTNGRDLVCACDVVVAVCVESSDLSVCRWCSGTWMDIWLYTCMVFSAVLRTFCVSITIFLFLFPFRYYFFVCFFFLICVWHYVRCSWYGDIVCRWHTNGKG